MIRRKKPLARSTKPIKRNVKPKAKRAKPRKGRLRGEALTELRRQCFERDEYRCQHEIQEIRPLEAPRCQWCRSPWQEGVQVECDDNPAGRWCEPEYEEVVSRVCGRSVTWESGHMAHIVPRSRGGKDELSNVTTKDAHCHLVLEHLKGGRPCPPKTPRS